MFWDVGIKISQIIHGKKNLPAKDAPTHHYTHTHTHTLLKQTHFQCIMDMLFWLLLLLFPI